MAGKPLKLSWLTSDHWPPDYTIPMFVVDLLSRIEDAYSDGDTPLALTAAATSDPGSI